MEKKWAYLHLLFCSCLAVLRLASAFAVHQGCYISSANGARAFPFKAAASDSMTIEVCRSAAATRFVDSFSLEAGRECWLGEHWVAERRHGLFETKLRPASHASTDDTAHRRSISLSMCDNANESTTGDDMSAHRFCCLCCFLVTDPLNGNLTSLTRFGAGGACNTSCAGDTRIVCGGQQQASVYLENDATPAVVPPNDYLPVGCFK